MNKRKLPIGIQSFEKLRNEEYIYLDKTEYIWKLINNGSVYFLSRPRRFGKSLLISTMEAYFKGKKELFKGLYIEKEENVRGGDAWQEYPVITFSLSGGNYNDENGLGRRLARTLSDASEEYDVPLMDSDLPNQFGRLIEKLHAKTGRQVVVLVDEYDKPLLETMIINEGQEEKNRLTYKSFFSVLKDEDRYLKFVFFTGVTKFSKVSIFSDLNQLKDISLSNDYSGICGITQDELEDSFGPEIKRLAREQDITVERCTEELARMYDGYRFSRKGHSVYNPFSLLNAFDDRDFGMYWFETGTPTFLVNMLRDSDYTVEDFSDGVEASETTIKNYRPESKNPIPLFYQAGYLTICGFDKEFRNYYLRFPNEEVRYGFLNFLAQYVLGDKDTENPAPLKKMVLDLRSGRIESFMKRIEALFAGIPYPEGALSDYEREWRNQIYLILSLLGQNVSCEVHSATGRADCVLRTNDYVYIFEFKLDKSADEALAQIDEKGYAKPYLADKRKVYKIGVNFSTENRNIGEWRAESAKGLIN